MKKIIVYVLIGIFVLISQQTADAKDLNIGYISLTRVFEGYKKVEDSNKELDASKAKVKAMLADMQKLKEGYDTLSAEAQEERKNEMLERQNEIRNRTMEVRKGEDKILRAILADIEKVSKELRKKKKVDYILDDRLIIDGPDNMDLTDEVTKLLNKRYKGK